MARKVLIVLGVVVGLLLLVIVTRPSTYAIERSATMKAPPATVMSLIDDFHAWEKWSPWDRIDPSMQRSYTGAPRGEGAVYEWKSTNQQVGEGRMTITDVKPGQQVGIKLEFLVPETGTSRTEFTLAPDGEGTRVTWRMSGENGFAGKAMSLVMNMDQLIGRDFEQGLASLKTLSEEAARAAVAQPPTEQVPEAPAAAEDAGTPAP